MLSQDFSNTAAAAKYVSECNDLSKGAIASKVAAKLYDLEVLQENIHNEKLIILDLLFLLNILKIILKLIG